MNSLYELFRLKPEDLAQLQKAEGAPKRAPAERFVKLPFSWLARLEQAHATTYRVAVHLLYQEWRRKGQPVRLANTPLVGVSRQSKWRALNELESLGLITVLRRPRKAPLVVVHLTPG
jgi:hypothetical protein